MLVREMIQSLEVSNYENSCQLMVKEYTCSTGELHQEGLPRNSVVKITDGPDMTLALYCLMVSIKVGCKLNTKRS